MKRNRSNTNRHLRFGQSPVYALLITLTIQNGIVERVSKWTFSRNYAIVLQSASRGLSDAVSMLREGWQWCWWHRGVGDLKLLMMLGCCWQNFDDDDIFLILMPDTNVKRWWMLVTKMFTNVTNILELSPKHFVSNIARKICLSSSFWGEILLGKTIRNELWKDHHFRKRWIISFFYA